MSKLDDILNNAGLGEIYSSTSMNLTMADDVSEQIKDLFKELIGEDENKPGFGTVRTIERDLKAGLRQKIETL